MRIIILAFLVLLSLAVHDSRPNMWDAYVKVKDANDEKCISDWVRIELGFKYSGMSAYNSEVWMLCVQAEDQRWYANDGFGDGYYGILARAVHDPDLGYWAAYQEGNMIVEIYTDDDHRVYINTETDDDDDYVPTD